MKTRTMGTLAVLASVALLSSGCQQSAAAGLSDADKVKLKENAQTVMKTISAGDWAGWAATFTDDAEWLEAHGPAVKGRAAIQAYGEAFGTVSELVLTQVDVEGNGDLAYVRGNFSLKFTPPGATAPIEDKGKYIEIWRKQADGSWKASKVIINSDLPMPGTPPTKAAKK